MKTSRHSFLVLALVLVAAALWTDGCASGVEGVMDEREMAAALRQRGLDPARITNPFGVTEEMRKWAIEVTAEAATNDEKLLRLQARLLDPAVMGVSYQWGYTGTAAEVFESRQANCLAFTNLFVGLARELSIPVYFLAVNDSEDYRKEKDLVVVSDHIAVGYGSYSERRIFDFSQNPPESYHRFQQVSDLTAVAMFYSNRGAEALQAGLVDAARQWLEIAVRIDPELDNAWVNLGVARRRLDDLAGAEEAYRRALEIDPRVFPAYGNLATLLRLQGRAEEARGYEEVLAGSPSRNPYTYVSLGDVSLAAGRLDEAEKLYRKAARLDAENAAAWAALGLLAIQRGDERTARRMLERARKGDPGHPRTRQLGAALSRPGA